MSSLFKRAAIGVIGVVIVLTWWTLRGSHENNTASSDRIPAKVWEGGAGKVTIDVESTDAATMRADFESTEPMDSGKTHRRMQTSEKVAPGTHSWIIEVPAATQGVLEFEALGPKVGSKLSWTVRAGDKQIAQDSQTLNTPLQANEAFFLQAELQDFATGKPVGED